MATIKTSLLKDLTLKISRGVEGDKVNKVSEYLEIRIEQKKLYFTISDSRFYLSMLSAEELDCTDDFCVTINATSFIKLISKTTSEYVDLSLRGNNLVVRGNGEYTFPVEIDARGEYTTIAPIEVDASATTTSFSMQGDTLYSIYTFNRNELVADLPVNPAQKYYYVDNYGAITCMESPYINNFRTDTPFKVLLPARLVSLFNLFRGQKVEVGIAREAGDGFYSSKIYFATPTTYLISYLPSESLLDEYPADQCRALQDAPYPGEITLDKNLMAQALGRLSIFNDNPLYKNTGKLLFTSDGLRIETYGSHNYELIPYSSTESFYSYTCYMNLDQLKRHITASTSDNLLMKYGNELSLLLVKENYIVVAVEMDAPTEEA